MNDEFLITATAVSLPDKQWTRNEYGTAKFIADQAIVKLGYTKAIVINTFGGHNSLPLYVAETTGSHECPES